MKTCLCGAGLAAAALVWVTADASPIIREPGAIYLSDFDDKPMRLRVAAPAPAYFDFGGARYVGTLRVGQAVEVQAISPKAYRVKGIAQQGQILGWVDPRYLETVPEETLAALEEAETRRVAVAALIAQNEVALGMTPDEVQQSLGNPNKKTSRTASDKNEMIWEYVTYANIPQQTSIVGPDGVVTWATTFVRTPVGTSTVTFRDAVVEEIDQSEGTILSGNQVTVVTPPIFVYW